MTKKEYYLYVKGKAIPESEEVYKAYRKIIEHENIFTGKIENTAYYLFRLLIMMDTL